VRVARQVILVPLATASPEHVELRMAQVDVGNVLHRDMVAEAQRAALAAAGGALLLPGGGGGGGGRLLDVEETTLLDARALSSLKLLIGRTGGGGGSRGRRESVSSRRSVDDDDDDFVSVASGSTLESGTDFVDAASQASDGVANMADFDDVDGGGDALSGLGGGGGGGGGDDYGDRVREAELHEHFTRVVSDLAKVKVHFDGFCVITGIVPPQANGGGADGGGGSGSGGGGCGSGGGGGGGDSRSSSSSSSTSTSGGVLLRNMVLARTGLQVNVDTTSPMSIDVDLTRVRLAISPEQLAGCLRILSQNMAEKGTLTYDTLVLEHNLAAAAPAAVAVAAASTAAPAPATATLSRARAGDAAATSKSKRAEAAASTPQPAAAAATAANNNNGAITPTMSVDVRLHGFEFELVTKIEHSDEGVDLLEDAADSGAAKVRGGGAGGSGGGGGGGGRSANDDLNDAESREHSLAKLSCGKIMVVLTMYKTGMYVRRLGGWVAACARTGAAALQPVALRSWLSWQ
jgi:hypothetical protein